MRKLAPVRVLLASLVLAVSTAGGVAVIASSSSATAAPIAPKHVLGDRWCC